ncbi:MAP7 domain-containing protein 3 isoform X1 [Spea bombifrons]|uniref:MAP7 domain-containing protein 3 isoform X1 n=1 Tax=Spea bombifrons TaxID=233779 RepID=UPI00234AD6A5|nr:MAP7 domain-containing protein 3 isoform X1 [Spea bombifrons]
MAEGSGKLKGLREQMVAAAQALAEERRSLTGSSPVPGHSTANAKTTKPVIDGSALRTDERQRLARERREEREKLNAAKESQLLEKERKAKLQFEKQMEEKQRKLEEQKQKDEQKRAAAEEKRKQRQLEEKEKREANVRRTLERSSQLDHRQKRWSWGGPVDGDKQGAHGSNSPNAVDIVDKIPCATEPQHEDKSGSGASKLSTSATNLKSTDSVIHKRLSSSSATLRSSSEKGVKQRSSSLSRLSNKTPNSQPLSRVPSTEIKGGAEQKRSSSLSRLNNKPSPSAHMESGKKEDKTAHRPSASPLDSSIISRLLAPTQSSLARSKSAAALSADGKDSPESYLCPRSASAATISTPPSVSKGPMRSRSIDRLKATQTVSPGAGATESTQKETETPSTPSVGKRPPSPATSSRRRSPSPVLTPKRAQSPTLESKKIQKNRPPSPSVLKQRPPSPTVTHKPVPIQRPSLTPSVLSATKKNTDTEAKPKDKVQEGTSPEPKTSQASEKAASVTATKTKDEPLSKAISGSTTAEEAAKILAEKRRLAREQREREEQERIKKEQEDKIKQEEMARRAEEEKLRKKEEAERLKEQQRLQREEDERKEEEERIRNEIEEQERLAELQQQKEEAEAKALEEAEKQRLEREKIMKQNVQERLERKKRIEEIMKRTRKTDQVDSKNEDRPDQDTEDEENSSAEANLHGRTNGVDSEEEAEDEEEESTESALTTPELLLPADLVPERNELFIDQNGQSSETNNAEESSLVTNGMTPCDEGHPHLNDCDKTEMVQNLNGKSNAWSFEEIIDLGIHSKATGLSSDSFAVRTSDQNSIDAATPKMAFEEGQINTLSKAIDSAAEM